MTEMAETYRLAPPQKAAVRERVQDEFSAAAFDDLARAHAVLSLVGWTVAEHGPEAPVEIDDPELRNLLRRLAYAAMTDGDDLLTDLGESLIGAIGWRIEREPSHAHPEQDGQP